MEGFSCEPVQNVCIILHPTITFRMTQSPKQIQTVVTFACGLQAECLFSTFCRDKYIVPWYATPE